MRAIPVCLALLLALAAGSAAAQTYKWVDSDGKVRYGDSPPPGVKATAIRGPVGPAAPAAAANGKDGKDAKNGRALTPAEQEQEFRKRQADAAKQAEKSAADERQKADREANCSRIQENLRMLQSGQRIARTDAKGERYFLDESQIAKEAADAERTFQQNCK